MQVTKKDGSLEPFSFDKIRTAVNMACEGLEVNVETLIGKFDEFLYDGIPTGTIQQNLIHHAKTLCSPSEPDWTLVAGRLQVMDMWSTGREYNIPFPEYVESQLACGAWTHPELAKWGEEGLHRIGNMIVKDRDLQHSYASVQTALGKYLGKNEQIQLMLMGNAAIIAENLKDVQEIYDALSLRKLSLASPWLSNLRSQGNISSCFIVSPKDDLDSIYRMLHASAKISKRGGGESVDISRCRANGSDLMGTPNAAGGVLGWVKLINDTAVYVNQGGKRKGAISVHLAAWHKDIIDFLDVQTEVGDQRKKSHDIKPQVGLSDLFMRLKDDEQNLWYMFCPHEVEDVLGLRIYDVYGEDFEQCYYKCVEAAKSGVLKVWSAISAKKLFIKIMRTQFETGMPYIAFLDEINRCNPNSHKGNIPCVNLCTESFSVVKPDRYHHTCNLASLVVGRIAMADLSYYAGVAVRILDRGIDLTDAPTDESERHNRTFRTIGIGIQGLHDIVARERKSFKDLKFITEVAERIQYGAVLASIDLAKRKGAYPAFKGSKWDTGELTRKYAANSVCPDIDWYAVQHLIDQWGIRNSQLTSPAPNTTTSIFMDAGAGIMPVYSAFFYEDNKNGPMPVAAMHLKDNPLSYARDLTKYLPWEMVDVTAAVQKFTDTGVSAEYLMDKNQEDFKARWLWDTIQRAWETGTKAVYYVRTLKKGEKLVKGADVCVGCSG